MSNKPLLWLVEDVVVRNGKSHNAADIRLIEAALGGQLFKGNGPANRDLAGYVMAGNSLKAGGI